MAINPFTGTQITAANTGQTYGYDDVVARINSRYGEGKNPALAAKSALQLGFPKEVIMSFPGMTEETYNAGQNLISSGAFASTASGTAADGAYGGEADVNSPMVQARFAAGLDKYGFPPEQVALMKANGTYPDAPNALSGAMQQPQSGAGYDMRGSYGTSGYGSNPMGEPAGGYGPAASTIRNAAGLKDEGYGSGYAASGGAGWNGGSGYSGYGGNALNSAMGQGASVYGQSQAMNRRPQNALMGQLYPAPVDYTGSGA